MAKLSSLQVFNKVANNLRNPEVAALASLTGEHKIILNSINHVVINIGTQYEWNMLKTAATITLSADTQGYALPTEPAFNRADRNSFVYNSQSRVEYVDSEDIDRITVDPDATGAPTHIYEDDRRFDPDIPQGSFRVYKVPGAAQNGKTIAYRYWSIPSRVNINAPNGTLWFPEGYEETVLVNLATAFVLTMRQNHEKANFYANVGNASLSAMKTRFANNMKKTIPFRAVL